jgi:hypothetical protein
MITHIIPTTHGMTREELQERLETSWVYAGRQAVRMGDLIVDPTQPLPPNGIVDADIWIQPEPMIPAQPLNLFTGGSTVGQKRAANRQNFCCRTTKTPAKRWAGLCPLDGETKRGPLPWMGTALSGETPGVSLGGSSIHIITRTYIGGCVRLPGVRLGTAELGVQLVVLVFSEDRLLLGVGYCSIYRSPLATALRADSMT